VSTVAGVVLLTAPGAGPRVAARLAGAAGLTLAGGDGDRRVAAVLEAADGRALEALSEALLAEDPEVLGVYPTYVAQDEDG